MPRRHVHAHAHAPEERHHSGDCGPDCQNGLLLHRHGFGRGHRVEFVPIGVGPLPVELPHGPDEAYNRLAPFRRGQPKVRNYSVEVVVPEEVDR